MRILNNASSKKMGSMNPKTLKGRWMIFSSFARMHVNASGGWGPACRPYQHVLQLQVDGDESWTIYRNHEDALKDGKIVCKKWDRKADWMKLLKLQGKQVTKGWHQDYCVAERQFRISSRWLKDLDRVLSAISIPPIAGRIRQFSAEPDYKLLLWRGWQESEFSWKQNHLPRGSRWQFSFLLS